tara:strand:+ start:44 stop:355 length:312 start_codon:yes stop_codon:yes gene_type:complete
MIKNMKPLDLSEVKKIIVNLEETEKTKQVEVFIKKFLKVKGDKSQKLKEGLNKLELLKLKEEHIVKIIDVMPEDASDLNKIFVDVALNEDETNKILEVIKKNK